MSNLRKKARRNAEAGRQVFSWCKRGDIDEKNTVLPADSLVEAYTYNPNTGELVRNVVTTDGRSLSVRQSRVIRSVSVKHKGRPLLTKRICYVLGHLIRENPNWQQVPDHEIIWPKSVRFADGDPKNWQLDNLVAD